MVSINDLLEEIDDMLVSLNYINLEPSSLDYEQTENQNELCCEQQQLSCIQES
jgi:hypothetical protein